jgi:hypothetical protein
MVQTWIKSGDSGDAHWAKLFGSQSYTVACNVRISKEYAKRVEAVQVGLANKPGSTYSKPLAENVCQTCLDKAIEQA